MSELFDTTNFVTRVAQRFSHSLKATKNSNNPNKNTNTTQLPKFLVSSFFSSSRRNCKHILNSLTLTKQLTPQMLEGEAAGTWARTCDTCRSAASTVFCRAHNAYLCSSCDGRVHHASSTSWHERVWVCEACERAPAAFLCKADAASLCSSCDADIHSANPLASRHHRVPILPIAAGHHSHVEIDVADDDDAADVDDEDETASWLLLNPVKTGTVPNSNNNGFLYSGEVDEYLDLVDNCNSCGDNNHFSATTTTATTADHYTQHHHFDGVSQKSYAGDSVVPVQQHHHFQLGLEFDNSKAAFSYNGSISQSVSLSNSLFLFPPLGCFLCPFVTNTYRT